MDRTIRRRNVRSGARPFTSPPETAIIGHPSAPDLEDARPVRKDPAAEARTDAAREAAAPEEDARRLLRVLAALMAEIGDGSPLGALSLDVSLDRQLGLGSLERVELCGRVEKEFGVRLPSEALSAVDSPRQLLDLMRKARGGPAAPTVAAPAAAARRAAPEGVPAPAPERARTLLELLEYRAVRDPDRPHVTFVGEDLSEETVTFGDLRREAGEIAAGLRALGLSPRGTVAIMLPTGREYLATFMGALLAGGVPVPIYPPFRLDRIAEYMALESKILENAGVEVLVTFDRAARVAEMARDRVASVRHVVAAPRLARAGAQALAAGGSAAVAAAAQPDDTALIQYTSGSTGDPKGVELSHGAILANIRSATAGVALTRVDRMVSWLPLYHDMGLIAGWLMNLYVGNETFLLSPLTFLTRPETWLQTIHKHRAQRSVAPNFAFELCTRRVPDAALAELDLSCVRTVLNGSEPINPATLDRFLARFGPVGFRREAMFPAYGLAENMVALAFPPIDRGPVVETIERAAFEREGRAVPAAPGEPGAAGALRFVAVGSAVARNEIRLVDDAGAPVGERREGRLHFRGPSTFKGYYRNPEATAAVKLAGGWVDSGDLAYEVGGEIFITGRVKDIIIKGGRNYYPHEIEQAAGQVRDIRNGCVAAFGLRDEAQGTEQIVVVAETKVEDPERRDLLRRQVVEAIAQAIGVPPDRVALCGPGGVPKTSSGKIRRTEARRLYLAGELDRKPGSFARQAAGLLLGGLPARAGHAARRAVEVAQGVWSISMVASFLGAFMAISWIFPAGRTFRRAAAAFCRMGMRAGGLFPRLLAGEKLPAGAAAIVTNHASYLDAFVLTCVMPPDTRYVVKGECKDVAWFGTNFRRAGHELIARNDAGRAQDGLDAVTRLLAEGEKVVIFAEGTFTREVGLRPFKLGAFQIACESRAPVVPVVIRGTRRAFRDGMWLPRMEPIEIEVLDPIDPPPGAALADVIRLRDRAAGAIAARLDEPRLEPIASEPEALPAPAAEPAP